MSAAAVDAGSSSSSSSSSLLSLDAEAFGLVLSELCATDGARLGASCKQLQRSIKSGEHAAQLWRSHCRELLGDLTVAYVASSGSAAQQAATWYCLYSSARLLDAVHWSAGAPAADRLPVVNSSTRGTNTNSSSTAQAEPLLARYGHTTVAAGSLLVLVGGMLRDGAHEAVDVAVLDLIGRRVIQPSLSGKAPPALRHLCSALVALEQGSLLHSQVLAAVQAAAPASSSSTLTMQQQQRDAAADVACSGHTLLLFGGLTPDNTELGGKQLHALWLSYDGSWGTWIPLQASGSAPAPRAYSCCEVVSAGLTMIVYGGWANGSIQGTTDADVMVVDGYLLMCIYMLDVNTLTWRRQPTRPLNEAPKPGHEMAGPSTCPGPRKQAMSCVRLDPVSGHEELMVLGGCGSDGLADFVPYALDLVSFTWRKGPVVGYLPPSREAPTLMQLSREWLLLLGGRGPRGEALDDVQRLHLPSLSWKPPLQLCSTAYGVAQRKPGSDTVDFSANACVVVGGSREGAYGLDVVSRLEVLLPGPPIVFDAGAADAAAAAAAAGDAGLALFQERQFDSRQLHDAAAGRAGGNPMLQMLQQRRQQQQLAAELAAEGSAAGGLGSCQCGSCCSCIARRAAADAGGCCGVVPGCAAAGLLACAGQSNAAPRVGESQNEITPNHIDQHQQQGCGSRPHQGSSSISSSVATVDGGALGVAAAGGVAAVSGAKAAAAAAAAAAGLVAGRAGTAVGGKTWQPPQQKPRAVVQLLLALAAVVLGLLLAYPSMVLQQAATPVVEGNT